MKCFQTLLTGAALCSALLCFADGKDPMKLATTPISGPEEISWKKGWKPRLDEKTAQVKKDGKKIELVFVGDSITNFWDTTGKTVLARDFAKYHVLNLGFSGDRTQQMLWVIRNGGFFSELQPKLVVMMIGTNNLGWHESGVKETIEGIRLGLESIRKQNPDAKILLFGVFPRGHEKTDAFRSQIAGINEGISKFADGKNIFYEDIGPKLMNPDGTIGKDIMPDFLHPSLKGYEIWAAAIRPYAERFIGK